ncbi:WW domain-binding protein 11-like [Varanus komodoensis]|uniref:WW domain-binding protein 11-like n=1 Tax=Varanus komodoensis TaxID=61221 RepID=UPI001CF781E1|nr:WW domain-binding protein 11-like [Varanus komodoensis]
MPPLCPNSPLQVLDEIGGHKVGGQIKRHTTILWKATDIPSEREEWESGARPRPFVSQAAPPPARPLALLRPPLTLWVWSGRHQRGRGRVRVPGPAVQAAVAIPPRSSSPGLLLRRSAFLRSLSVLPGLRLSRLRLRHAASLDTRFPLAHPPAVLARRAGRCPCSLPPLAGQRRHKSPIVLLTPPPPPPPPWLRLFPFPSFPFPSLPPCQRQLQLSLWSGLGCLPPARLKEAPKTLTMNDTRKEDYFTSLPTHSDAYLAIPSSAPMPCKKKIVFYTTLCAPAILERRLCNVLLLN